MLEVIEKEPQELGYEFGQWMAGRLTFEKDGPKIVIILDNASIHKKEEFIEKIKLEMPNLVLEFLSEYSLGYNLVELVWHSAKEFTSNRLFKSIEDLKVLINKLFNEGDLITN